MIENLNKRQRINKQSISKQDEAKDRRNRIVSIENTLGTANSLEFTGDSVSKFISHITNTIKWVRASDENVSYKQSKDAVLANLRKARIKLSSSVVEYTKKGRTEKFFLLIEDGRASLDKSLKAW